MLLEDAGKAPLDNLPEGIKLLAGYVTAGNPEYIAIVEVEDETELVRYIKEVLNKAKINVLPVVDYKKYRDKDLEEIDSFVG